MGRKANKQGGRPSEEVVVSRGIPLEETDEDAKGLVQAVMSVQEGEDDGPAPPADFVPSRGLSTFEANELLLKFGRNELEDKSTPKVCLSVRTTPHVLSSN